MDAVYRGYRIAIKPDGDILRTRITKAGGTLVPLTVTATALEGSEVCLERAKVRLDAYIAYLTAGADQDDT